MPETIADLVNVVMQRYDETEPPRPGIAAESRRAVVEDYVGRAITDLIDAGYTITKADGERQAVTEPEDGQWALVELMGHRRIWGRVTETTLAGQGLLRVDIPNADGTSKQPHYFQPSSIYMLTPCTRDTVMEHLYPPKRELTRHIDVDGDDQYDGDDEDEPLYDSWMQR